MSFLIDAGEATPVLRYLVEGRCLRGGIWTIRCGVRFNSCLSIVLSVETGRNEGAGARNDEGETKMATMKTNKITCILALVLGMVSSASADEVVFNDPNLKAAVEAQLGVTNPTAADMLLLTGLYADNKGICDLTVLEYATNLDKLWLDANKISDISPLAGLTNLRWLILILQSDQRHLPSGGIDEPEISHALSQSDQRHLPPGGTDEPDW